MSIANVLITRGWTQHRMLDPDDGSVCLAGAVREVLGLEDGSSLVELVQTPEWRAVRAACPGAGFMDWNDSADRTFDEVLRVAKLADEILDAQ